MSTLPFVDLEAALHPNPGERFIRLARLRGRLLTTKPVTREAAATSLARIVEGASPTKTTLDELALELSALSPDARGLACILAPALEESGEDAIAAREALGEIGLACVRAIGASIPASVIVDATLLETLRAIAEVWGPDRLTAGETERAEELARRVTRALGLAVAITSGTESPAISDARLRELDARAGADRRRAESIEAKIRAGLPPV